MQEGTAWHAFWAGALRRACMPSAHLGPALAAALTALETAHPAPPAQVGPPLLLEQQGALLHGAPGGVLADQTPGCLRPRCCLRQRCCWAWLQRMPPHRAALRVLLRPAAAAAQWKRCRTGVAAADVSSAEGRRAGWTKAAAAPRAHGAAADRSKASRASAVGPPGIGATPSVSHNTIRVHRRSCEQPGCRPYRLATRSAPPHCLGRSFRVVVAVPGVLNWHTCREARRIDIHRPAPLRCVAGQF